MQTIAATLTTFLGIPAVHPDFEGHFPDFPLLPAVSQLSLIKTLIEQHLGLPIECMGVSKAKFSAMLRPNSEVKIVLTFIEENEVHWQLRNATQIYSQGNFQYLSASRS